MLQDFELLAADCDGTRCSDNGMNDWQFFREELRYQHLAHRPVAREIDDAEGYARSGRKKATIFPSCAAGRGLSCARWENRGSIVRTMGKLWHPPAHEGKNVAFFAIGADEVELKWGRAYSGLKRDQNL